MVFSKDALEKRWAAVRYAFSSKDAFVKSIEVEATRDENGNVNWWINEGKPLDSVTERKLAWSWWNYVVFYFGVGFGNWTLGSTMIGIGLNWWQSIIVIFVSQMISSVAMYFNGRCGIVYHIGYPCVARSVFGMWGSYYYVAARAALALIWFGVQLYSGASLMNNMLRAIFGHYYTSIPNKIPASMGIDSATMLCFFLLWLAHLSLAHLRPNRLKKFFWVKSFILFPAIIGLFIFCMLNTKGDLGPLYGTGASGSQLGWLFMYAINSGMGNTATYITNQPDMVRWAKTKTGAQWAQLVVNPISVTMSATLGILATSAMNNKWNLDLWNQWDLLDAIMDHYWTPGARFAVALCAGSWCFYFLGINISSNMLPFGSDSTMLLPRFLTIPRGNYIVTFAAFAIVPWKIEASATILTQFLSGYALFMASVASIMICDYYLLTNGNVFVRHLYDGSSANRHYYYHKGWNVQAAIAYVCGIALPFPGFIGTLGATVPASATHLDQIGWLLSFWVSFVVYYAICYFWPTRNQRIVREMGLGWEQMSYEMVEAVEAESLDDLREDGGGEKTTEKGVRDVSVNEV
ncbi:uracil permease-like protein [Saccharata proteae CBS 121410]|uniref:Uracil permease-like protein n=1 Tax=Saccharata proteae CBS 121410 TaxID=1314787 RepID=A0A9P4LYS5_9PEZI|nr:uracil permease-like protein [Saccharata proteae CBS 121410]